MPLPKIVFTDIDGVWTDGGMYYDRSGNELKKFNTADSAGVLFLSYFNVPTVILTGENTEMVAARARKLKIEHLYQGVQNKAEKALEVARKLGAELSECAFIGDDLNDIALLKAVGIGATPANAAEYVKKCASICTQKTGGQGAFREFVEHLLLQAGLLDRAIEIYLSGTEGVNQ